MVSRIGSDGTRQPSPENSYQPSGKDAHCPDGRDPRSRRTHRVDRDDARRVVWDATQQSPARCGRLIHAWNRQLSPTCSTSLPSKNTSEQLEPSDPADASRPSIAAASVGSQKAQQECHIGWHQRLAAERSPRRQLIRPNADSHCFWPRLTVSGRTQFS